MPPFRIWILRTLSILLVQPFHKFWILSQVSTPPALTSLPPPLKLSLLRKSPLWMDPSCARSTTLLRNVRRNHNQGPDGNLLPIGAANDKENEQLKLPSEQITHTVEVGLGHVDCAGIDDGRLQLSVEKS